MFPLIFFQPRGYAIDVCVYLVYTNSKNIIPLIAIISKLIRMSFLIINCKYLIIIHFYILLIEKY